MKVIFIRHSEPLPIDSAEERMLRTGQMVEYFDKNNIEVLWLTSSFNHFKKRQRVPGDYSIFTLSRLKVIQTPGYKNNISIGRLWDHWIFGIKSAKFLINNNDYDCVISSFPTVTSTFFASLICKIKRKKLIIDYRDKWPEIFYMNYKGTKKFAIKSICMCIDQFCRMAFKCSDNILCPTKSYRNYISNRYSLKETKFVVSPLGYKKESYDDTGRLLKLYSINNANWEAIFVFAGTLGYMFDFAPIFELATKESENKDLYVFCGEGERYLELKQRYESYPNILFTGWLNKKELDFVFNEATVALAPYLNISNFIGHVPNKIMEYMSYGLPVITCLNGESRDIIEQLGGYFYEQGSVESLYEVVNRMSNKSDEERALIKKKSLELFYKKYSSDVVYSSIINMINNKVS